MRKAALLAALGAIALSACTTGSPQAHSGITEATVEKSADGGPVQFGYGNDNLLSHTNYTGSIMDPTLGYGEVRGVGVIDRAMAHDLWSVV